MSLAAVGLASECRFANVDDATVSLAARIWEIVDDAVATDGEASMILAGGSTPVPLYHTLQELPMHWDKLTLCPSDERWVPPSHADSNDAMFREQLLNGDSQNHKLLSLARKSDSIDADAKAVNKALAERARSWDVVLLGMGSDGHTASLFPHAEGLQQGLETDAACVVVKPENQHARISLSLHELLNSKRIVLLLSGDEKWSVYQQAVAGSDVNAMPVRAILHQNKVPVDVYWWSG